jgi:rhodanese-related sulfurtransferase
MPHITAHQASPQALTAQQLLTTLQHRQEIALIDIREHGEYSAGHVLLSANLPLWRLGLLIGERVPRRDTAIVLVDENGQLQAEATHKLLRLGYSNIWWLQGGIRAWKRAGFTLFIDENVPSKALGEVVESVQHTPNITVEQLKARQQRGEKVVIVDGRPAEEFARFSLPGAVNIPNGELTWRIRELAPDPQTLVVVNCAGRTRSIIGAQTLIDAGLPNPVAALTNGTMAWLLAGETLLQGQYTPLPEPSEAHQQIARLDAKQLIERAGIVSIDSDTLARFAADKQRTLYRFDTRTHEEYLAGHLPGFRWAPGGQLVQATDEYAVTRGARIVIADWDGVRAPSTVAWLQQLTGFEVYLYQPQPDSALDQGDAAPVILHDPAQPVAALINVTELAGELAAGTAQVIDIDNSLAFIHRHIAGARFIAPHRLTQWLPQLTAQGVTGRWVLTSRDGLLAELVAAELLAHSISAVALQGGNNAWFAAGQPTEKGRQQVLTGEEDQRLSGYNVTDLQQRDRLFREYLAWEVALVDQLKLPGVAVRYQVLAKQPGHRAQAESVL